MSAETLQLSDLMSEMMGQPGGTWNGMVHFSGCLCIFGRR